jgi:3-phytase
MGAGLALALASCSPPSSSTCDISSSHEISETWRSQVFSRDDLDSLAFFPAMNWVIATAKGAHDLIVSDAATGRMQSRRGRPGTGVGEFQRPNGIAVADNLLFVVERDNHRIQVLQLPEFLSLGHIGEDVLRRPYGVAVYPVGPNRYEVFVTDNYEIPEGHIPPASQLHERIKQYLIALEGNRLTHRLIRSFGDTTGDGILRKVESIALDEMYNRVLIAEEQEDHMSIKIYTLSGEFTGNVIGKGIFQVEPEGIGLYAEGDDGGWWIATDQHKKKTVFHVFGRKDLEYRGFFSGQATANTDGICVTNHTFSHFPKGGLFAIDDDRRVVAFSWEAIARKFGVN